MARYSLFVWKVLLSTGQLTNFSDAHRMPSWRRQWLTWMTVLLEPRWKSSTLP